MMLLLPMVGEPDEVVDVPESCRQCNCRQQRIPFPEEDPDDDHDNVHGSDIGVCKPEKGRECYRCRIDID